MMMDSEQHFGSTAKETNFKALFFKTKPIHSPTTKGDPTFYRWKDAVALPSNTYPTRKRGKSGCFLLGGIHLTYYTYTPYIMLRMLSATECGAWTKETIQTHFTGPLKSNLVTKSLEGIENFYHRRATNKHLKLIKNVKHNLTSIVLHPWFYLCNKSRYPAWEGKHDSRVF